MATTKVVTAMENGLTLTAGAGYPRFLKIGGHFNLKPAGTDEKHIFIHCPH